FGVGHHVRRIEHAELHACRKEADEGGVDGAFRKIALLHSVDERLVVGIVFGVGDRAVTLVVHAAEKRDGRGLRLRGPVMMAREDVAHGIAVGNYISLEAPLAAKLILEQIFTCAGRLSLDRVISAHDGTGLTLNDGRAESRLIGVELVVPVYVDIGKVARRLGAAVDVIVLGRGDDPVVLRVITLHSGDEGHTHAAREEGILAVRLLAAAPAGIAENIQIRRPEIETTHDTHVVGLHILHVLDAPFDSDIGGHGVNARNIEGRAQSDRLGKLGYAGVDYPMKRLAPPVIGGHVEPWNGSGIVHKLRCFFLKRHAVYKISRALLGSEIGVQICRLLRLLRAGDAKCPAAHQPHYKDSQFRNFHALLPAHKVPHEIYLQKRKTITRAPLYLAQLRLSTTFHLKKSVL